MFTSKEELNQLMGVDAEIAKFFVDRKVPVNNLYWKGRLLYVARGNGYLFIPLLADLMYRTGISKSKILSEEYVQTMEKILDYAAQYEFGEMDFQTHIKAIDGLVSQGIQQPWLIEKLRLYFQQQILHPLAGLGDENPPLNRGDALLYWFALLGEPRPVIEKLIRYWYGLLPALLLLDDLVDLKEDQEAGEENAMQYYGYNAAGVRRGIEVIREKLALVGELNPLLTSYFEHSLSQNLKKPYFEFILKD